MITVEKDDFLSALPQGGRLLGMDLGSQSIGLALCDAGWSIASPAHTHKRSKFTKDKIVLADFCRQQSVKGLVIGLPLNMDGSESPRSQASRAFARNIAILELPILLWDERWSTVAAERAMIAQDMSRAKRAEKIDAHAAALILQAAIDRLSYQ